jgi:hypothetical protein
MGWRTIIFVGLFACGDGVSAPFRDTNESSDSVGAEVWKNDPLCPSVHPALAEVGTPLGCSPGLECRFDARGCSPGQLPITTCRCRADGWACEAWARNCYPVGTTESRLREGTRPRPKRRTPNEVCDSPAEEPRDGACLAESAAPSACEANGDCAPDEVCLDGAFAGYESRCACFDADCLSDADCGTEEACACGVVGKGGSACGFPYIERPCSHTCVPATCRTDADCGATGICSPSFDACGTRIVRWACHDWSRDECLSDAECSFSEVGWVCRATEDGRAWRCTERTLACEQP